MCKGFGGWLTEDGKFYFSAPNLYGDCAHSDCIDALKQAGYSDANAVPIEYPDWTAKSFRVDKIGVPEWVDRRICDAGLKRVKPIWKRAKRIVKPALDKYVRVRDGAWDKYNKTFHPNWYKYRESQIVVDAARAKYDKTCKPAQNRMIAELRKIEGFCEND